MPHPASRVLAMLELLQAHRRMTGRDLAARLGVDERTVRRYAATLDDLGIPVTADRGRYGGYRLLPGFKLPPLMLTDEEAVAVVLGLVAAGRLGLTTGSPAAAAAEAKITRVLPAALAGRLAALRASLGLTLRAPRDPAADPGTDLLLALGAATRARQVIALTYRSGPRRVDPYGLVFHSGRWYLVAHDHRHGDVRSFRLDRIAAAEPTGESFEPPPGFDAVAHVTRQWAGLPWRWEVEVLLEADITEVRRRVPAAVAEVAEDPRGVLLSCRAESLPGMAHLLAGLGWPFTVLRPAELRTAVAEHAARLADFARRGDFPGPRSGVRAEPVPPARP
ncbi:helix-turn-helix transcriptional regulator [Nucisporomicrobium flavum]|uniref:helix-turn-helix transcriptional regulator n=2 Tax=Nucisporomicrobium flavum TaxID=2785915 RepID=UPI003C2FBB1E